MTLMIDNSDFVAQPEDNTWGVRVSEGEYLATVAKVAKINERAAKRGFTGSLSVEGVREVVTKVDQFTGFEYQVVEYITTITGTAPSYGGHTFLARVDRIPGTDSFTTAAAPGVEGIDRDFVPGVCDHCGHNRQRKNTYLLRNDETGAQVQVGSTCIKDFLGWSAQVVFFGQGDVSVEEGGSSVEWTFTTESVIEAAYAATRAFGYRAGGGTADIVRLMLGVYRPNKADEKMLREVAPFVDEAKGKGAVVREWLAAQSANSDYMHNLQAAAASKVIGLRQIGLIASAPQAMIRATERQAEREAKAAAEKDARVNEYLAPVGTKKVRVEGTIRAIRYIPGDYGTTVLYTILSTTGHQVKWFASREALGDKTDVEVTIEGTVKKHEEYEGTKSTVLTRCKAL